MGQYARKPAAWLDLGNAQLPARTNPKNSRLLSMSMKGQQKGRIVTGLPRKRNQDVENFVIWRCCLKAKLNNYQQFARRPVVNSERETARSIVGSHPRAPAPAPDPARPTYSYATAPAPAP